MSIDRRQMMKAAAGAATLLAPMTPPALAASGIKIVSLDYAAAETLLALDITPVGLQSTDRWSLWVKEPPLPPSVVNIGQDLAVNMEVIASLKPDLIITTPYTDTLRHRLARIAPVHMISVYDQTGKPLHNAFRETRRLGQLADIEPRAQRYLRNADAILDHLRDRLAGRHIPPLSLVSFMDQRHVRVYGKHGLYQTVLDRLGISNAWSRPTNAWGFATVGLEELARAAPQDMHLIALEPILDDVRPTLERSPIWRSMPVVQQDHFAILPAVLPFGMVPSALRFARLITDYVEEVMS